MGIDVGFKILFGVNYEDIKEKVQKAAEEFLPMIKDEETEDWKYSVFQYLIECELIHTSGDWDYENEEGVFGVEMYNHYGPGFREMKAMDVDIHSEHGANELYGDISRLVYYDNDINEIGVQDFKDALVNILEDVVLSFYELSYYYY